MDVKQVAWVSAGLFLVGCGGGGGEEKELPPVVSVDTGAEADTTGGEVDAGGGDVETAPPERPADPEVWGAEPLEDQNPDPDIVEVNLTAKTTPVDLGTEQHPFMYTFNGMIPGPLIEADVGDRVIVHFENRLSEKTTIHWHGLRIDDEMDGTPRVQDPIGPRDTFTYDFVVPDAGSYWYHPHVRGNEQVERGLYGLFIVRGEDEPKYHRERYFTIDDILLTEDGIPPFLQSRPELMHGRTGNVLLTNGTAKVHELEATKGEVERWRIVNPSNARTMEISVEGAEWRVIGTDGGLLPEPYTTERLEVPVGARYDLEVRYTESGSAKLKSHMLVRNDQGEVVTEAFDLADVQVADSTWEAPTIEWPDISYPITERKPMRSETIAFDARQGGEHGIEWTLNGKAAPEEPLFTFGEGKTVRITLNNQAGPEHPFHLHGQFFTVVDDGRPVTDKPGLKDTVLVPGQTKLDIIAYMDNPGRWMTHCHILEHVELGMMAEMVVEE